MTICPHGVEFGIKHEPQGVLAEDEHGKSVVVPKKVSGPEEQCRCCKGTFIYDEPLDKRKKSEHCAHCQATVASSVDQSKALKLRGGPLRGQNIFPLPGTEPQDHVVALEALESGHYSRAEDGHYDWVDTALSPLVDPPEAPYRKNKKKSHQSLTQATLKGYNSQTLSLRTISDGHAKAVCPGSEGKLI